MAVQRRRTSRKTSRARRTESTPTSESRRREIVAEAVRLMEEKGFAAMSVQHIADALAFSKANFYHHIKSKEILLREVFVDTYQLAIANISAIVSSRRSAPEQLNALVEFYVSLMLDRRAVMLVWFKERAHLTPPNLEGIIPLEHQLLDLLTTFYTAGMDQGYFRRMDPNVLRLAIFGMCFQMTRLPPRHELSRETITRQLQEFATSGLLIAPPRDK